MFKGRYPGLFELSHSCYREDGMKEEEKAPLPGYGDFLDVEWEFIKGSVVDEWVRKKLEKWKNDENQVLTLAFCGEEAERNMAQALYLPGDYFRYVEKGETVTERDPVIWVYQMEIRLILRIWQRNTIYLSVIDVTKMQSVRKRISLRREG